jgi:hypothetical protein
VEETIRAFGLECRGILKEDAGPRGLDKLRRLLEERLLSNPDVIKAYLSGPDDPERNVLYEDPELGFCIVAHRYRGPHQGRVHDHGPAWAIYGQVTGKIHMTEYDHVEPPKDGAPGKVRQTKAYDLVAGKAVVYPTGQVHAPSFPETVRVIRIEGRNLEGVPRAKYVAV